MSLYDSRSIICVYCVDAIGADGRWGRVNVITAASRFVAIALVLRELYFLLRELRDLK